MRRDHSADVYVPYVLRPTGLGAEVIEVGPTHCPNGHALVHPNVQRFYSTAPDGERRSGWRCWECDAVTWGE